MLQMTPGSNKESKASLRRCYLLRALSGLGVACENRLVVCLHWLFSLANPSGGVAFGVTHSVQLSAALFGAFVRIYTSSGQL